MLGIHRRQSSGLRFPLERNYPYPNPCPYPYYTHLLFLSSD
jgi:hypothetical protein